jgi:hypothetical protein
VTGVQTCALPISSTYNFFMTDEEIKTLAQGLIA